MKNERENEILCAACGSEPVEKIGDICIFCEDAEEQYALLHGDEFEEWADETNDEWLEFDDEPSLDYARRMQEIHESFERRYVSRNAYCPHCGQKLIQYHIPTEWLWVWPGEWPDGEYYPPDIALNIFTVYDAPKGEVHEPVTGRFYRFHHIWVGTGEHREEKLIMLDLSRDEATLPLTDG